MQAKKLVSRTRGHLLLAAVFLITFSLVLTFMSPASGSSQDDFLKIEDDTGLLNAEQIHKEVNNLLEAKNIRGEVPPVQIKTYGQSDKDTVNSIKEEHEEASDGSYDGTLVFYIKGEEEALIAKTFSSQLSEERLGSLRDRAVDQLAGYQSATEAIGNLAKNIALVSTDVEEKKSIEDGEEKENKITLFVKKEVGKIHEGTLLLSCAEEEIEISPTSITEQGQEYRLTFELSETKISKIKSAGCQLEGELS